MYSKPYERTGAAPRTTAPEQKASRKKLQTKTCTEIVESPRK